MVSARDGALGFGLPSALGPRAPVRGWLEASVLGGRIDVVACPLARHHIRTIVLPAPPAERHRSSA